MFGRRLNAAALQASVSVGGIYSRWTFFVQGLLLVFWPRFNLPSDSCHEEGLMNMDAVCTRGHCSISGTGGVSEENIWSGYKKLDKLLLSRLFLDIV